MSKVEFAAGKRLAIRMSIAIGEGQTVAAVIPGQDGLVVVTKAELAEDLAILETAKGVKYYVALSALTAISVKPPKQVLVSAEALVIRADATMPKTRVRKLA